MTTQHSYIKPSRDERHALSRDLNKEATFYNSKPIVTTMKQITKPSNSPDSFSTPEERKAKAKELQVAAGGVPEGIDKTLEKQHKQDKAVVRKGIASFVVTGTALARIRD